MLLITKLNCVRACVRQAREDRQADTSGSSSDQSPTLCSCLYPEKGTWSRLVQKGCCVVSNPSADVATTVAGVATNSRCKQVSITLPRSLTCAQLPQRRAVSPNGGALKGCCSRTTLCYPPLSWNLFLREPRSSKKSNRPPFVFRFLPTPTIRRDPGSHNSKHTQLTTPRFRCSSHLANPLNRNPSARALKLTETDFDVTLCSTAYPPRPA